MQNILFRCTDRKLLNKAIEELITTKGYDNMHKILLATNRTIVGSLRNSASSNLIDIIVPSKVLSEEMSKVGGYSMQKYS